MHKEGANSWHYCILQAAVVMGVSTPAETLKIPQCYTAAMHMTYDEITKLRKAVNIKKPKGEYGEEIIDLWAKQLSELRKSKKAKKHIGLTNARTVKL